nr:transcription factor DUO1 [Tanacetum cinerariifolium]
MSMEKLQINKSSSGALGFKKTGYHHYCRNGRHRSVVLQHMEIHQSHHQKMPCSSSYCKPINMVPFLDLMNPTAAMSLHSYDQNHMLCQLNYTTIPVEENSSNMPPDHPLLQNFPHVSQVELPPLPPLLNKQDIFSQLANPYFYAVFGHGIQLVEFPYIPPDGEGGESGWSCV